MPSVTEIIKSLEDAVKEFNKQTGSNNAVIEPKVDPVDPVVPVTEDQTSTEPVVEEPSKDVVVEVPDIVIPKEIVDIGDTIKDFIKQVDIVIEKIKPLANSDGVYWGDGTNPFDK